MTSGSLVPVVITLRGGPAAGRRERATIDRDQPIGSTTYYLTLYRAYNKAMRTCAVYAGLTRTSYDSAVINFQRIETY